jgi:uncharacterized protein (UPF0335 family)
MTTMAKEAMRALFDEIKRLKKERDWYKEHYYELYAICADRGAELAMLKSMQEVRRDSPHSAAD